jgi:hypothetical protein
MILALVVGYGVAAGVVIASSAILLLVMGMPPDGRPTTPYLIANIAASFIAAIAAGYACGRLAPVGRRLITVGLLMLLFLSAAVATNRTAPAAQQPQGYLALVTLLGVIGLWTGAMIERAGHGNKT